VGGAIRGKQHAAPKDQPMSTLLYNLLMHCGPTPIFEYTLIAGGVLPC
jgi:hypothetical protein